MAKIVYKNTDCLDQIGTTAGKVWNFLADNPSTSYSKITKSLDVPRDLVIQAIGWLAREGKLSIVETNRGKLVSLVEPSGAHKAA